MSAPAITTSLGLLAGGRLGRILGLGLVVGAGFVLVPVLLVATMLPRARSESPTAAAAIPALARPWLGVVNAAARAYEVNPYLLLAVLSEETQFGTHPDTYGANFLGCCFGPFQLNVVDGTWATVKSAYRRGLRPAGYPRRASPHPSVYDSFDAACAAAALLRRKVGGRRLMELDDTAWQAARGYQGAGPAASAYADRVLAHARAWNMSASEVDSSGALSWPVKGPITSPFGPRWGRMHAGIDLGAPHGTPVTAAAGGIVTVRGWVGGYGRMVCISHARELTTCYAHLGRFAAIATVGNVVAAGDPLGVVGCTGHCFGPHLHFEVRASTGPGASAAVDPMPYLGSA